MGGENGNKGRKDELNELGLEKKDKAEVDVGGGGQKNGNRWDACVQGQALGAGTLP